MYKYYINLLPVLSSLSRHYYLLTHGALCVASATGLPSATNHSGPFHGPLYTRIILTILCYPDKITTVFPTKFLDFHKVINLSSLLTNGDHHSSPIWKCHHILKSLLQILHICFSVYKIDIITRWFPVNFNILTTSNVFDFIERDISQ